MRIDDLKKVIAKLIRENFHQSLSEATYDLGNKQYTDKNMTPTEILDLAMAYAKVPGKGNPMYGNKMTKMIIVANDLAKLTGTTQLDAKTRGKESALILVLMKNKLITKEEYVELYKNLLAKQMVVIRNLKNADPASRMIGGAAARQAHKDMKGYFDESVNEMSKNDVHFKEIMKMYDSGGSFTKKKVAVVVCNNPRASRRDIEEELLDSDYSEITQYQHELQIAESVQGDKIQNLNNRIKALKDKISATKNSEQKSKFQNTLKNALQSLSNIRKAQTESVNEAKPTGGKTPSNYAFTPKDAEKKYKSAAISMLIPKLNPKDIPNIQKQLSKMDVDADFNIEKDGVRVWTRRGDYSNVGDVLKSKGLKSKQTMPTDADYQKWDDKLRASSGIKPTSEEAKEIGALTGVRGDAVQKFIDDNNIHARKLLAYLKMKGPHTLSNRMDISTAIVGKANNKFAQGIIKAFSESKVNEAFPTKKVDAKVIADKMRNHKETKGFADKIEKLKMVSAEDLDKMLPDYVAGSIITKIFKESVNEAKVGNPFGLAAKVLQSLGFTGGYVSWIEGISFEKQIKGGVLQITIVQWGQSGEQYHFDAVFFPEITKSTLFGLIKKKVIDYRNGKWVSKDKASEIVDLGTGMFELSDDDYEKEIKTRVKNAIGKIHESIKLTSLVKEAKFEVYHDSYTSAINTAREWAEKQGYTINDDDAFTKIGMGPRKPSEGKTNKFSIELSKDDKVQRKQLHIQVYGMRTKYELNCYIG